MGDGCTGHLSIGRVRDEWGRTGEMGRVVEISSSAGADKHLQHHAGLAGSH